MTLTRIREKMQHAKIYALYIDDPITIEYLTNLKISQGTIIFTPKNATILLDSRYNAAKKQLSDDWTVLYADIPREQEDILKKIFFTITDPIGFDGKRVCFSQYEKMCHLHPKKELFFDASDFFAQLRRPKNDREISLMKAACLLCEKGMQFLFQSLKEGISEKELAHNLEIFFLQNGADGIAFEPIIAFGKNAACPHWKPSETRFEKNSVALFDIGAKHNGYCSDMTRVAFYGTVHEKLHAFAQYVQKAAEIAYKAAVPGVLPSELDTKVREYFTSLHVEDLFIHGLGHGVGLEIHEMPRLRHLFQNQEPLEVGDVIAIEPGLYIEGVGGIRLENTGIITKRGFEPFSTLPLFPFLVPPSP